MRYQPAPADLFVENRKRLRQLLPPNALVVVNANDILPTTTDGSLTIFPNSDLYYLTGVEQEESVLVLMPDAAEESQREMLFVRETNDHLKIWEGAKLTKERVTEVSGVKSVRWLSQFEQMFQTLMTRCDGVFLNSNEHPRADLTVETRDARFIASCQRRFPLHRYHRLAPLMAQLRAVKSAAEVDLIRKAVDITDEGLRRVYRFVKPGVKEYEVEAELAHTFISRGGRFAYNPIIAGGANSCVLHYIENDKALRSGDVLLLDVAAAYGNYNSDLTRTIPVNGKFTKRQRSVYEAVLAVLRGSIAGATVGKPHRDWHHESQVMMNQELLKLGLLKPADVRKHTREAPACRKYYMHGLGHSLGLGVHDLGDNGPAFRAGMVLTVEPGVYLPDEGFGVRLENDILLTENGPIDLCAHVPIEAREVEALMRR